MRQWRQVKANDRIATFPWWCDKLNIVEQIAASQAPYIVPLTVDQYHTRIATGILRDGDPIELIDGILV
jgi:hypothetical protein